MSEFRELTTNPLLAKIAPQPDDQRQFIILIGYVLVDESSQGEDPTVRVYPELDLHTYLEVQIRDVVWAEKAIPGQESSPTMLVINAAAKVNRVTTTKRVETEFLGGIIAASFLPTAASGAAVNVCGNQDDVRLHPDCPTPRPGGGALVRIEIGHATIHQTGVPIGC
jgi:hypothetical protein